MKSILSLFKLPESSKSSSPLQSLALVPDRPSLVYHAGELVTGHVVVTVNGQLDISQIQVVLTGRAHVFIPLDRIEQQRPENKVNGMQVTHFKKEMVILDLTYNPATVYNQQLTTGRHDIGYSFMLPPTIPSSLENVQFGGVEYRLTVNINGYPDKCSKIALTVLSNPVVPLENLATPVSVSNEKYVGLINGKRLWMKCTLPTSGWTLGSTIPITVSVENESKKFMSLKTMLKQEMQFIVDATHKKMITNKIAFADGPQIDPRQNCSHTVQMSVPLNLPIIENTCPLIMIKYSVSVKLEISGSFDLHCRLPIFLTHIMPQQQPHQQQQQLHYQHPHPSQQHQPQQFVPYIPTSIDQGPPPQYAAQPPQPGNLGFGVASAPAPQPGFYPSAIPSVPTADEALEPYSAPPQYPKLN